jgi:hypothetical protein
MNKPFNLMTEAKSAGSAFLVTGAFNPYTRGHEEIAQAAASHAASTGYSHFYHGLGASENAPDAPLAFKQKEKLIQGSHAYIKDSMPGTKLKFGTIPQKSSVSPFHHIVHLIEKGGHKHITVAVGPDQFGTSTGKPTLKTQIEAHIKKHGGVIGSDGKTIHKTKIDFHPLASKRNEEDLTADQLKKLVVNGRIPVEHAKAGRMRKAILAGDDELASAFMPESIHKAKGTKQYATMLRKQFTDVVPGAEEKRRVERNAMARTRNAAKKKNITEYFSPESIESFINILEESKAIGSSIMLGRKEAIRVSMGAQSANAILNELANRKIARDTMSQEVSQEINEESLNEATKMKKKSVASPSKVRANVRTEVRSAGNPKKKDTIRKQEERKGKKAQFAVVATRRGKTKIVKKADIGNSQVLLKPEQFDKGKAAKYLDDSSFAITPSSKELFPSYAHKKEAKKEKNKKEEPKKKKKKKAEEAPAPTVTQENPRTILPQLPETPPHGKAISKGSTFPDWNHKATDLEEAIPIVMNQMLGVKTGTENEGTISKLQNSQTLYASAERAANLIFNQIGETVSFHMGKNKGRVSELWKKAGATNGTSKTDVIFIPKDLWEKSKGDISKIDMNKCIRASVKCGQARILNAESGEATATIEAAMEYAGNIAAKNPKVSKLVTELKKMVSQFVKSAELGQWDTKTIKRMVADGQEPRDKQFQASKVLIEEQELLHKKAGAKLIEIFDSSDEFKMGFCLESMSGSMKFGGKAPQTASHVLALSKDGTDVKMEQISESLIKKLMKDLSFRGGFKGRSKGSGASKIRGLSTVLNIDLNEEFETDNQQQQQQQVNTSIISPGSSAQVDQDLKDIGDDVVGLMNYIGIEPEFITSNSLDMSDYINSTARDYNIITIDGETEVAIPVVDYSQFDTSGKEEMSEAYDFINDFLVENMNDQDAVDFILSSGLVSPETITKNVEEVNAIDLLHEMWENSVIKPELFESFIEEARNYKKEYKEYHGTAEQRANRSKRVLARRKLMKTGRVKKGDGKDVDHKDGNPQNNSNGNLRVLSKSKNRAMHEEHGAGEIGTKALLQKYIKDTPFAVNPTKDVKYVKRK